MKKVSFNLHEQVKELEKRRGKDITHQEIADATGLSRRTITTLMNNEKRVKRIEFNTIDKLLAFFDAHSMPITPGHLFTVTESD